jgi:hypothetical protein
MSDIIPVTIGDSVSADNAPAAFATVQFAALAKHLREHHQVDAEDVISALLNTVMAVGFNCDVPADLVARSMHALASSAPAIYALVRDAAMNLRRPN